MAHKASDEMTHMAGVLAGRGWLRLLLAGGLALSLAGCIGGGVKMPDTLLDLTPAKAAVAGTSATGEIGQAIGVMEPAVPRKLDVQRVPVQVSATQIAYVSNAMWVEKPARLFQRLLAETLRADGHRLIIDGVDRQFSAGTRLNGQLLDMGYDAQSQSALVRFEAMLERPGGQIATQRFESSIAGVPAKAGLLGPALNQAANDVAEQVAQWVTSEMKPGQTKPD